MIEFTQAIKLFYSNFVNFDGRSTRAEYWWVQLYMALVIFSFAVFIGVSLGSAEGLESGDLSAVPTIPLILLLLFIVAHILPGLALQIRRFHDLNQSGWLVLAFVLLGMIPVLGTITAIGQLVWFCFRGTDGYNKYGPDPLAQDVELETRTLPQNSYTPRAPMFGP